MDYKTKMGLFIFYFIGAGWLLPANRVTLRYLHCPAAQRLPLQKTTGQHYLTYPDLPWLVPPSRLACPGEYPENLTHLAQDTTPLVENIDLLESLASMLFITASLYVR